MITLEVDAAPLVDAGLAAAVTDAFSRKWGELRRLDGMHATPIRNRSEPESYAPCAGGR